MLIAQQKVFRRFWYPLFRMADLDAGPRGFTLLNEPVVVWKTADGSPAAFLDRCCHRTARLSKGYCDNGRLVCAYHGWAYDGGGRCVDIPQQPGSRIPANAAVPAFRCKERYGYAWVALDDPIADIPEIPEAAEPGFRQIHQFCEVWQCTALRRMENAVDFAHQSYVHKAMHGRNQDPIPPKSVVTRTDSGYHVDMEMKVSNPQMGKQHLQISDDETVRYVKLDWWMPFARKLGITYPNGLRQTIFTVAVPIDDKSSLQVQWSYRNDTEADVPAASVTAWDRKVQDEDKDILEATEFDIPLDTHRRLEFHMDSDKPGLLMRTMLLELMQKHGEAEVFSPPSPLLAQGMA
jgi:phenylpropionate dioxygenase-like ring-hydroxylating dioxygenase large terminal subunit